jgi:predicted membrane chloride channel (bestrophin family)
MRLVSVQSVIMDKDQAIQEARRVWINTMGQLNAVKRRIRVEAEEQIERETKQRREIAARAIFFAYEQGATKTALRAVSTKDHHDFASYITLGEELERDELEREGK